MLPCPGNLRVRFPSLLLSALTVTEARSFLYRITFFFFPELAPLAVADSFWVASQLLQDESLCPGLCCVLQVFFN